MAFGKSYSEVVLYDKISILQNLLEVIKSWEDKTQSEIKGFGNPFNDHAADWHTDTVTTFEETRRAIHASLAVAINAFVESSLKSLCIRLGTGEGNAQKMNLGELWKEIEEKLDLGDDCSEGRDAAEKSRKWANAYKHNSGRAKQDTPPGFSEGTELPYEQQDWGQTIQAIHQLLESLESRRAKCK